MGIWGGGPSEISGAHGWTWPFRQTLLFYCTGFGYWRRVDVYCFLHYKDKSSDPAFFPQPLKRLARSKQKSNRNAHLHIQKLTSIIAFQQWQAERILRQLKRANLLGSLGYCVAYTQQCPPAEENSWSIFEEQKGSCPPTSVAQISHLNSP